MYASVTAVKSTKALRESQFIVNKYFFLIGEIDAVDRLFNVVRRRIDRGGGLHLAKENI